MTLLSGISNGLVEVWSHKLRSGLTILCVMLGVASLVVIVGFVDGLFLAWRISMAEYGGIEKISVMADRAPKDQEHLAAASPGITVADADAIESLSRFADIVSPEIDVSDCLLRRGARSYVTRVQGVRAGAFAIGKYEIVRGRALGDLDYSSGETAIILGSAPVRELFDASENPIGQLIDVKGRPFTVIGCLKHYEIEGSGWNPLQFKNDIAFVPLKSAQRRLDAPERLTWLNVRVRDAANLPEAVAEIENIVRHSHRGIRDFRVQTEQQQLEMLNDLQGSFILVGAGIGLITLLVGGIGITNLMLASINERLREIGVRKALGAWDRDVFIEILTEATLLSVLGGIAGIAMGMGGVLALQPLTREFAPPQLSATAVLAGFTFSVFVGIVAGLYPSIRAARLDPIEALRYE